MNVLIKRISLLCFCIGMIIISDAFAAIDVVNANSPNYDQARMNLNAKFNLHPAVIYFCHSTKEVQQAIKLAKQLNKKIRIRSGRHSYEAFSNGNDIAIIDVSLMKGFQLSESGKTVTLGPGLTLGEVYSQLWKSHLTIPGGACPTVGLSGLVLGGGVGSLSRKIGLTCDNVIEYQMVNANGEVLTINSHSHSDLFWALCGAGNGNFGVITSIKFKTFPVEKVVIYKIRFNWDKIKDVTDTWFQILQNAPRDLTFYLYYMKKSPDTKFVGSTGIFLGSTDELKKVISPLLKYADQSTTQIKEMDYMSAIHWASPSPDYAHPRNFKASSLYLSQPLSHSALDTMNQVFSNPKIDNGFVMIDSLGGAVADVKPDQTAFAHRNSIASVQIFTVWKDPKDQENYEQWVADLRQSVSAYGMGAYINYPDSNLKNWQEQYYGTHYTRLQKIKLKYDPDNLFDYSQSIKLP